MIIIAAFLLGITFASAGLIAKQINSGFGANLANRNAHLYVTWLGKLSNITLPVAAIASALFVRGIEAALVVTIGIIIGAVALGVVRPHYSIKLLLAFFGVPLGCVLFILLL